MPAAAAHTVKHQLAGEGFSPAAEIDTLASQKSAGTPPDDEAIARRAYALWEERVKSDVPGSAEEDWHRAEQELAI